MRQKLVKQIKKDSVIQKLNTKNKQLEKANEALSQQITNLRCTLWVIVTEFHDSEIRLSDELLKRVPLEKACLSSVRDKENSCMVITGGIDG